MACGGSDPSSPPPPKRPTPCAYEQAPASLKVLAWAKYMRRLPALSAIMARMRDFYMELTWNFESSVIPFIARIAPSDTYRLWKRGPCLRADMTLAGFDGLRIKRKDQSLLFFGEGLPEKRVKAGTIVMLNHERREVYDALEGAGGQPSDAELAQDVRALFQTNVYKAGIDVAHARVAPQTNWRGQERSETVGAYKARVVELQGVQLKYKSRRGGHRGGFSSAEPSPLGGRRAGDGGAGLVSPRGRPAEDEEQAAQQHGEPAASTGGRKSRLGFGRSKVKKTKEKDAEGEAAANGRGRGGADSGSGSGGSGERDKEGEESEYTRGVKPMLWLTSDFPLDMEELMPLLDLLASKVKAVQRLKELLTTKLPPGAVPVKMSIPIIPTIRVSATFNKFEELPRRPSSPAAARTAADRSAGNGGSEEEPNDDDEDDDDDFHTPTGSPTRDGGGSGEISTSSGANNGASGSGSASGSGWFSAEETRADEYSKLRKDEKGGGGPGGGPLEDGEQGGHRGGFSSAEPSPLGGRRAGDGGAGLVSPRGRPAEDEEQAAQQHGEPAASTGGRKSRLGFGRSKVKKTKEKDAEGEAAANGRGRGGADSGSGSGGSGERDKEGEESEYTRGVKPMLWLTSDFPLDMEELMPLLDLLASKVKAVQRLKELLTTKLPPGAVPVKMSIPIIPTIRVSATFNKFEELPRRPSSPAAARTAADRSAGNGGSEEEPNDDDEDDDDDFHTPTGSPTRDGGGSGEISTSSGANNGASGSGSASGSGWFSRTVGDRKSRDGGGLFHVCDPCQHARRGPPPTHRLSWRHEPHGGCQVDLHSVPRLSLVVRSVPIVVLGAPAAALVIDATCRQP
eukprot:jgi/Mesen1/6356/ME000328S05645